MSGYILKEPYSDKFYNYPEYIPIVKVDFDTYTSILQIDSMSQAYTGANILCEFRIVDSNASILVPYLNGRPAFGFYEFDTYEYMIGYINHNQERFTRTRQDFPELFL